MLTAVCPPSPLQSPSSLNLAVLARPSDAGWIVGRLLLIGALAGFAYALEQPTGGLLLAAGAVTAVARLRRPSTVVWIALAALPWIVLHHAVVYSYGRYARTA